MAGSEFKYATLLFDLVDRLRAGEPLSPAIIQRLQDCKAPAARDRMDWLERRFAGRLIDTVDAKGLRARCLKYPEDAPGAQELSALIAGRVAAAALDHLRGSRLHSALTRAQDRRAADLEDTEHAQFDRAARTYVRYHPTDVPDARRAVVDRLFEAIRGRQAVAFDYLPLLSGRRTYTIEPWLIVDYRGELYLYGRKMGEVTDDAADHRRNFSIDGIESLRVLDTARTAPPPDAPHLLRSDLAQSVGFFRVPEEPVDIRLRATGWFATRLRRAPLHRTQSIISEMPGEVIVSLRARICPELSSIILGALPDVEVLEPRSLVEAVRRRLERAISRIGSGDAGSDHFDPDRIS